jgi:glycosyltransferase involved in cell wall biosynthesis
MTLSVIICTHNPNMLLLDRVLNALRNQTLALTSWNLVIVDNSSETPVEEFLKIEWHPSARIVREDKLGLTNARIRGIQETSEEFLIFVDDDNILASDYLETTQRIGLANPALGAWGGSTIGEFESKPPGWFHVSILGIREIKEDKWSRSTVDLSDCPIGAGITIRREVADAFVRNCHTESIRMMLGRTGKSLMGCEDFDLAFTACDLGLERGVFKDLRLVHFIPRQRLTEEYFIRMKEGLACSMVLLSAIRNGQPQFYKKSLTKKLRHFFSSWALTPMERKVFLARERGREAATRILYPDRQT